MPGRNETLQRFIDATAAAIRARATRFPDAMPMADRLFAALNDTGGTPARPNPARLAVCGHLEDAFRHAQTGPVAELAAAFAAIEPEIAWHRRPGSAAAAGDFHDTHANAVIVGECGLEARRDLRIGVSLVAPNTSYPRHRHPPEELYVVLSPGNWMQGDTAMTGKRSGDLVHNVANIWHAMQATKLPLLAIWCLWIGDGGARRIATADRD